jgi:hypothetical protein
VANGIRHYYPAEVPDIIEVTDHWFIETHVIQNPDVACGHECGMVSDTYHCPSYELTIFTGNLPQTVLEHMMRLSTMGWSHSQRDGP